MPRTLLLVGTRKGCFLLESDADRRDWTMRGPYCEGWPVYHAIYEPVSGAIYAAAASEWHGSAEQRATQTDHSARGDWPHRGRHVREDSPEQREGCGIRGLQDFAQRLSNHALLQATGHGA